MIKTNIDNKTVEIETTVLTDSKKNKMKISLILTPRSTVAEYDLKNHCIVWHEGEQFIINENYEEVLSNLKQIRQ